MISKSRKIKFDVWHVSGKKKKNQPKGRGGKSLHSINRHEFQHFVRFDESNQPPHLRLTSRWRCHFPTDFPATTNFPRNSLNLAFGRKIEGNECYGFFLSFFFNLVSHFFLPLFHSTSLKMSATNVKFEI